VSIAVIVPALRAMATAAAGFRRNILFPPKNDEKNTRVMKLVSVGFMVP